MKTLESYIKSIDTKDLWKNKPIKETYKTIQHFLKWLFKKDPWTKEYTKDDWERLNSMFVYIQHKDLDANQLEDIIMNHNKPFTYCRFYTFKNDDSLYYIKFLIMDTNDKYIEIKVNSDKIYK